MTRLTIPLIAAAALASCSGPTGPSKVTAADLWCRAAPVGAPAGGCYVTLTASGDDRLVAVETGAADHGEIHTMEMDGGVMRMRPLKDGIALPAGEAVALKPDGMHLMIIAPKATLAAGGEVPLTLKFAKAPPLTLSAPIRQAGAAMGGGMEHH